MDRKINILHLEDNKYDAELIRSQVDKEKFHFHLVMCEKEFLEALECNKYDVILADFSLPGFDGVSALRLSREICPGIPFIFVSGAIGEEAAVTTLKEGATDYILKNNISRLDSVINRAIHEMEVNQKKLLAEENSRKYNFIINTAEEFMTLVNRDYCYEAVNDSYCRMHNLERSSIIGKKVPDLWGSERFDTDIKPFMEKAFQGDIVHYVKEFQFGMPGKRYIDVSCYPFYTGSYVSHVVVVSKDVTEREQAKMDREKLILDLRNANSEIQEMTLQLVHNERLSVLGELSASIAHEMSHPLTIIKCIAQSCFLDIQKGLTDEDEMAENLKEIAAQVDKMAEIIDHIRSYSRKDVDSVSSLVDMNSSIRSALRFLEIQMKNLNIRVQSDLDENLPFIYGNPVQMEQVLTNLLLNARDALLMIDREKKRILIRTWTEGDHILVEIDDNGIGIPSDIKEKIFDSFFTTKSSGAGTGLGLSISKKIISEYGGTIAVESEVMKGSRFLLKFSRGR